MSSAPGNYLKATLAGRRRRRRNTSRRRLMPRRCRAPVRSFNSGDRKRRCSKAVSAKLETLKTLVNPTHVGKSLKADELFQETADYIVLLRTQVVILQRLVEFYGSSEKENVAAVS
ncbi:hypothetical protein EV1_044843 [Malus domestica]